MPQPITDLTRPAQVVSPSRTTLWLGRSLFVGWLLYSAAALGWFLAQDPFLSQYLCGVR